jgi:hypothetical protein
VDSVAVTEVGQLAAEAPLVEACRVEVADMAAQEEVLVKVLPVVEAVMVAAAVEAEGTVVVSVP